MVVERRHLNLVDTAGMNSLGFLARLPQDTGRNEYESRVTLVIELGVDFWFP